MELVAFAKLYTNAWCSQNPANVAAFFAFDGSLQVNDGPPAVGRPAIMQTAQSFMTAFPDLVVEMDDLVIEHPHSAVYKWTLKGTYAANQNTVCVSGFEQWTIGEDGLIADSKGHFDSAEYQRQLGIDA